MISPQKYLMVQRILLWGGLFLVLLFTLIFQPLCDQVEQLKQPVEKAWTDLLRTRMVEAGPEGINTAPLDLRLRQLELAAARLGTLSNTLAARLSFNGAVESKMRRPFQLVDYQNERQLSQEELLGLAAACSATVAPAVWTGYPEYSADASRPELLWGHLAVAHESAKLALRCGVTNLISLSSRPPRPLPGGEGLPPLGYELPVSLNLVGSWPAVRRFLACLPVRHGDRLPPAMPELPAGKPVLYIERLVLRKEAPEKPGTVRMEIRIVGVALPGPP